jgi:hypothetical protein
LFSRTKNLSMTYIDKNPNWISRISYVRCQSSESKRLSLSINHNLMEKEDIVSTSWKNDLFSYELVVWDSWLIRMFFWHSSNSAFSKINTNKSVLFFSFDRSFCLFTCCMGTWKTDQTMTKNMFIWIKKRGQMKDLIFMAIIKK